MKKYFSVGLILLSCHLFAQSLIGKKVVDAAKNYDSYFVYKQSGSPLFRTVFLKTVTVPVFTYAYSDANGIIKIQLDTSLSFADEYYSDIDTGFTSSASDFSEGLAVVKEVKSGLCGFINTEGKVIIQPQYTEADKFSDGLAYFAILERCSGGETRPNKMGYIDKSNKRVIVLPKQLSELYGCCYFKGEGFRNGTAMMSVREHGFDCNCSALIVIDRTGKVLNHTGRLLDANDKPVKIQ